MSFHLLEYDRVDSPVFAAARVESHPEECSLKIVVEQGRQEGHSNDDQNEDDAEDEEGCKVVLVDEAKWYAVVDSYSYDD